MARTITVLGGNLFQIALEQLGDATQWNRIATASKTGTDPLLPTGVPTVLIIPSRDSSAGGGIYDGGAGSVSIAPVYPFLTGADGALLLSPVDSAQITGITL